LETVLRSLAAGAVERFAAAASFRGNFGALVGPVDVPSCGSFVLRLPVSARTPSTAIAAIVNFERNDIT
jgi:hypothetical protein